MRIASGERCSFCDAPAQGVWHPSGGPVVAYCGSCAVEVLPALAADSIDLPPCRADAAANRSLNRMVSKFWRAIALRALRDGGAG
jgi:hypothetical protein